MSNLSYHFYKGYYKDFKYWEKINNEPDEETKKEIQKYFESKNERFINFKVKPTTTKATCTNSFELFTTYPGLITGTGYTHGIKADGEFKIGFAFDFVTGLPILSGSSVKGTIKSAFPSFKYNSINNKYYFENDNIDSKKAEWILNKISELKEIDINSEDRKIESEDLQNLARFIEESFNGKVQKGKNDKEKFLSTYKRDIFYEALITNNSDKDINVLGIDSITPHNNENPLKNPTPLPFLKIIPNTSIQFNFKLNDTVLINKELKLKLYKSILLTFGIGAKNNVGYGQLQSKPTNLSGIKEDLRIGNDIQNNNENNNAKAQLKNGEYFAQYLKTDNKNENKHILLVEYKNNNQIEVEYTYRLKDILTDINHQIIVGIEEIKSRYRITSFRRVKR